LSGVERRLARIFGPDRRTIVVAFDHAAYYERPAAGLASPASVVEKISLTGVDAVLMPLGTARTSLAALGRLGFILTVEPGDPTAVETAVALGADAVKAITFPWQSGVPDDRAALASLAGCARRMGMPLMVETIPGGWQAEAEMRTPERLAAAARIAAELGADIVKTFAPADPADLRAVVDYCPVPVVVLGGGREKSDLALLETVAASLEAGAAGVAIGRNVWGHPRPEAIARALASVVHEGRVPSEALRQPGLARAD
jgi:DhnA family fructose-bisphosphate aldolase class Ia